MSPRHLLPVVAVMVLPLPAQAAETLWTEVVVRVYDATGMETAERRGALDVAASIVSSASIELIWKPCDGSAKSSERCSTPLAPGELTLRIVRAGAREADHGDVPLGDALVDTAKGTGVLATIYIDRVNGIATQTGSDRQTLLGRAIAHELGHLLMATSAHGAHGLMQPIWSRSDLRRGAKMDWSFSATEIAAMKARTLAHRDTRLRSRDGLDDHRAGAQDGAAEFRSALDSDGVLGGVGG